MEGAQKDLGSNSSADNSTSETWSSVLKKKKPSIPDNILVKPIDKSLQSAQNFTPMTSLHRKTSLDISSVAPISFSTQSHNSQSGSEDGGDGPTKSRRNLYVANLDSSVSESELRSLFSHYGTIISVFIIHRPGSTNPTCGFVNFSSHDEAQTVIDALNASTLRGKRLRVDFAFINGKSGAREDYDIGGKTNSSVSGSGADARAAVPLVTRNRPASAAKSATAGQNNESVFKDFSGSAAAASETAPKSSRATKATVGSAPKSSGAIKATVGTAPKSSSATKATVGSAAKSSRTPVTKSEGTATNGAAAPKNGTASKASGNTPNGRTSGGSVPFSNAGDTTAKVSGKTNTSGSDGGNNSNPERSIQSVSSEASASSIEEDEFEHEDEEEEEMFDETVSERSEDASSTLEFILTQVECAITSIFDSDKLALVQTLKRQLESDLDATFDSEESGRIVEHLLAELERLVTSLATDSGEDAVWNGLETVKESIRRVYSCESNKKKRKHNATLAKDIEEMMDTLRAFEAEEKKRARLVVQMIVLDTHLERHLLGEDASVSGVQIETRVRALETVKTVHLSEGMWEERQARLEMIKTGLMSLKMEEDVRIVMQGLVAKLRDTIKMGFLAEPARPKAGKRFPGLLDQLRAELRTLHSEREAKLHMMYELNQIESDVQGAHGDAVLRFIAERKQEVEQRLAGEKSVLKRDTIRKEHSKAFWAEMESFLMNSFDKEWRDTGINLYVCNLHPSINEAGLKTEFARFGNIVSVRIFRERIFNIIDVNVREPTKYGFVKFDVTAHAHKAMEVMNGKWLNSKQIEVRVASGGENLKAYWRYLMTTSLK